jgi:uncharacterized membrane protein
MSKKLTFAVLAVVMIFALAYFIDDVEKATAAISAVGLISLTYLGGQSGVDGVSKFKEN